MIKATIRTNKQLRELLCAPEIYLANVSYVYGCIANDIANQIINDNAAAEMRIEDWLMFMVSYREGKRLHKPG